MTYPSTNELQNVVDTFIPLILQAYTTGHREGFEKGRALGFIEGINSLKPAISDGLRHGSSACGAAMQGLKNLGIDDQES